MADALIDAGLSPRALCRAMGFDLPQGLEKYDPEQPRDDHGRWTTGGGSGGGASISYADEAPTNTTDQTPQPSAATSSTPAAAVAISAAAAAESTLLGPLSAEAAAGLATMAAGLAGATAIFGVLFVPWRNGSATSQGPVPDEPTLTYSIDHDEGLLRIIGADAAGNRIVVPAHLGEDGLYHDDETGAPIGRSEKNADIIITAAAHAAAERAGAAVSDQPEREQPKLCPDPSAESIKGRKLFDIQYEQYVRSLVNPQRDPQLPPGLAVSLTNPGTGRPVVYDDCRESDGAMIEAKGHYADVRQNRIIRDSVDNEWLKRASRQIDASGGRNVEWYFHEQAAADAAGKLFADDDKAKRIKIFMMPYPGGVPKKNPRINSIDDYKNYEDQE